MTDKDNAIQSQAMTIDYDQGLDGNDLETERRVLRSQWAAKLAELRAGIEQGRGDIGVFYRLAEYTTPSGAKTALRNLGGKEGIELIGRFELRDRIVVGEAGQRTSELWAAYMGETK